LSDARKDVSPETIRVVRVGHGANCSSIGSVIDTLFVTALVGGAVFAAICAALGSEPIRVTGSGASRLPDDEGVDGDARGAS
jgi:hypothetical protein